METLPVEFYKQNAVALAQDLLGHYLLSASCRGVTGGLIVETEAYGGVADRACHAFAFHRSDRTQAMYGPAGTAYVYQIYGLHYCLNVVALRCGSPQAVLIRGLYPLLGIELMAERRRKQAFEGGGPNSILADGPGKLCQALNIELDLNGKSFAERPVQIVKNPDIGRFREYMVSFPRVGLGQVEEFRHLPWRFSLECDRDLQELFGCSTKINCI